jgi:Ser/Thr protein kinase RdoA (MazF antagonist)
MKQPVDRPVLDADTALLDPLDEMLDGSWLPPSCEERYATAVESLADVYAERLEGVPLLRIHGDCHRGNLLRGREGWFFLDFDDFALGPAVHDVWVLVPGHDREAQHQRDVLIEGYRQFRDFEPRWLALVEPLRAARILKISSWIARRWKERSFQSTFPHFGTALYWESETRDLEELVRRLDP